jgi:hypothetical protein
MALNTFPLSTRLIVEEADVSGSKGVTADRNISGLSIAYSVRLSTVPILLSDVADV